MSRWSTDAPVGACVAAAPAGVAAGALSGTAWRGRWSSGLRSWLRPRRQVLGGTADEAAALAAFDAWCAAHAGCRLRLGLGAPLVQICVAPAALAQADLCDYAQRQLAHYLGAASAGPGWTVAASSDTRVPLACAAPRSLVAGLQAGARRHGVRLLSLSPWWAHAAQAWLAAATPRTRGRPAHGSPGAAPEGPSVHATPGPMAAAGDGRVAGLEAHPARERSRRDDRRAGRDTEAARASIDAPADTGTARVGLVHEPGWVTVLVAQGGRLQRAWSEPDDGQWRERLPAAAPVELVARLQPAFLRGAEGADAAPADGVSADPGAAWMAPLTPVVP